MCDSYSVMVVVKNICGSNLTKMDIKKDLLTIPSGV